MYVLLLTKVERKGDNGRKILALYFDYNFSFSSIRNITMLYIYININKHNYFHRLYNKGGQFSSFFAFINADTEQLPVHIIEEPLVPCLSTMSLDMSLLRMWRDG